MDDGDSLRLNAERPTLCSRRIVQVVFLVGRKRKKEFRVPEKFRSRPAGPLETAIEK
jgi:hypothetical protein